MNATPDCDGTRTLPWTRLLARLTDALFYLPFYFIILSMLSFVSNKLLFKQHDFLIYGHGNNEHIHYLNLFFLTTSLILISLIFYSFTDSVICKKFGRNLGHKIYNLKMIAYSDAPLIYQNYLRRSFLVSSALFLMAFPLLGLIAGIIFYKNYKLTGSTYWDRHSGLKVSSLKASKLRNVFCLSMIFNLSFVFMVTILLFAEIVIMLGTKKPLSQQQKQFLVLANKTLPRRVNTLLVAQKIDIKNGNVVFHYLIKKKDNSSFTHNETINLGLMKLASPKTAMNYLCTSSGKVIFNYGKKVIYSYTLQGKTYLSFYITPSMCPQ